MILQKSQNHNARKQISARDWGEALDFKRHKATFLDDRHVLYLDCDTHVRMTVYIRRWQQRELIKRMD